MHRQVAEVRQLWSGYGVWRLGGYLSKEAKLNPILLSLLSRHLAHAVPPSGQRQHRIEAVVSGK